MVRKPVRKPNWGMLYGSVVVVAGVALGAVVLVQRLAWPAIWLQIAFAAGLVAIPLVVIVWLRRNRLGLLYEGTEPEDLYHMTTYEYPQVLWIGVGSHLVGNGDEELAEAAASAPESQSVR